MVKQKHRRWRNGRYRSNSTQVEADTLMAMEKQRIDQNEWVSRLPADVYANTTDLFAAFEAFMRQCNITQPPKIQRGLF
jgi:hypothetical protein